MDTITLAQAEANVREWSDKLTTAQTALAQHEEQIGQRALDEGVDHATQEVVRRQVEVKMAETALAAAQAQRAAARRHKQEARAKQLRADRSEALQQLEEHAQFVNEWGPKVQAAREAMEHLSRRVFALERQADEIEYRLQREVAA